MKRTAEANARRSETMKRVWAERKAKAEHNAIYSVHPRCQHSFRRICNTLWREIKEWFGSDA